MSKMYFLFHNAFLQYVAECTESRHFVGLIHQIAMKAESPIIWGDMIIMCKMCNF